MSLYDIPAELRERRQWILWRFEWRKDDPEHQLKPTKIPYIPRPGCGKASVTNPADWGTFDEAVQAPLTCVEPVDHDTPLEVSGYSGLGFVFTANDPYTGIDLDDTQGNEEAYQRQFKVFREFDSYSELSPSGKGMHIFVKGQIPGGKGRRRAFIELYCQERFFTMTGNVQRDVPIAERQELLNILYEQMGPPVKEYAHVQDQAQTETDEEIIAQARRALNGDKFSDLYDGDWVSHYPGDGTGDQSRADFALIDILAYWSKNQAQVTRLFLQSQLGQRDKARSRPSYVENMVKRAYDNQPVSIDLASAREHIQRMIAETSSAVYPNLPAVAFEGGAAGEPGGNPAAPVSHAPGLTSGTTNNPASAGSGDPSSPVVFPPGLVGEIASFILSVSPRPVPQISLAAAIALMSGICGRSYNVSGTGLNQYIIMLAMTGAGKDAVSVGISKLMAAVKQSVRDAGDFQGPGELVSSAGLIKWLARKPAVLSILGEFGVKMQELASPSANAHLKSLERVLLQMYSKSGAGNVFDPMAYSDIDKNTDPLHSPALTILGESVPERFYSALEEHVIASGLLPRFLVFEYLGDRQYLKEDTQKILPPLALVETMASLTAHSLSLSNQGQVVDVPMTPDAAKLFKDFDRWTTDEINKDKSDVNAHLWNRAHLKAMKLAAVVAVGINYHGPLITYDEANYATNEVVKQTRRMLSKFETGQIGAAVGSEIRQRQEVYKVVGRYMVNDWESQKKYGGTEAMHKAGIILDGTIQRRCIAVACFRHDKFSASGAIKRTIEYMLSTDELREIPKADMQERFGTKAKAYIAIDPKNFLEAVRMNQPKE